LARNNSQGANRGRRNEDKERQILETWADTNAKDSDSLDDLADPFKTNVKAFIAAMEAAKDKDGNKIITVEVNSTKRPDKRAYLFHWCWQIAQGKKKPSEATAMAGVPIEWDHGDVEKSKAGAQEMVTEFGLAVPPKSTNAPALTSNHISGKAVDMTITIATDVTLKTKDGKDIAVPALPDANTNLKLHDVANSYSVKKLTTDLPHWSIDGK
jgi:hypothetical protein